MRKLISWFDDHLILSLAAFLLIFIPLYPKLPLLEALPGYIVRVRLEDFLVSFTIIFWFIYLLRGKMTLKSNPLFKPISTYLIVGLLSVLSAIFIIKTVPMENLHIGKILLHYLRRIEYFSLFFIFFSSVKSIKQIKVFLVLLVVTILFVAFYGFGQKYLYWPAFSTMNREFSKGWVLYISEHARVLSTFGGHYDLAAYMMIVLLFLWSLFFSVRKYILKIPIFFVLGCAFWTLILTASRASFLAYLFGLPFMFFFYAYKKGIKWSLSRWFVVTFLSIIVMLSFGDMSERFTKLLRIDERVTGIKKLLLSPVGKPPTDKALFLQNNPNALAEITSITDQPPSRERPSDVYSDMPLLVPVATGNATMAAVPRTYSKNAFMYDLSTAIRFDALWPMAIKGFKRNPLLGAGYANLNKTQDNQFTEAESTDNDYLRALGETGLLGFLTFYGILAIAIYFIWRNLAAVRDPVIFASVAALGGSMFGLLANASYIDVFESSKVAFSFWSLTGLVLAGIKIESSYRIKPVPYPIIHDLVPVIAKIKSSLYWFFRSDLFLVLTLVALALSLRLYKINTPLADWHSWRQADTSSVTRNYVKDGVNLLYPTYDDVSNVASGKDNPKGLRFVEFPIYNLASVFIDKLFVGYTIEISGRLTSIFASLGTLIFLFLLVRKYLGRKEAFFTGLFFAILPYNIFYSRVILPEPFLVFLSTGMLYFTDKFVFNLTNYQQKDKFSLKSIVGIFMLFAFLILFSISAILVKPFAAVLLLPLTYLWFKSFKFNLKSLVGLFLFLCVVISPFIIWRMWMNHYPEGIPASSWLLNGDNIRFKGAFFQWLFADRLGRLILGYWGLPLFFVGLLAKAKKEGIFFRLWGLAILLYVTIVATGNVRHDYYQALTIPIIVIFMAKGVGFLLDQSGKTMSKITVWGLILISVVFMEMFGWYHIRDFYNINHPEIVEAGNAVERKTKDKALVVAPYMGDTAFLYQTKRVGWPIIQNSLDEMIQKGAQYYVSVSFDDLTRELMRDAQQSDISKRKYKIIELADKYVIIQLVPDQKLPR